MSTASPASSPADGSADCSGNAPHGAQENAAARQHQPRGGKILNQEKDTNMASISTTKTGSRSLQFVDSDGRRRTVSLDKTSQRIAAQAKANVEEILSARRNGVAITPATAAWLDSLDDKLRDKLARAGLCEPPEPPETETLGAFVTR